MIEERDSSNSSKMEPPQPMREKTNEKEGGEDGKHVEDKKTTPRVVVRRRRWTVEEDKEVVNLITAGLARNRTRLEELGIKLDRTAAAIKTRAAFLAMEMKAGRWEMDLRGEQGGGKER